MNTQRFLMWWNFLGHQKNPVRDAEDQGGEPDRMAADMSKPGPFLGVQLGVVDDGQVPIPRDANQQKYPTVEADLGIRKRNLSAIFITLLSLLPFSDPLPLPFPRNTGLP